MFLLSIPILRGRWRPPAALRDEQEHDAMVQAERAKRAAPGGVSAIAGGREARYRCPSRLTW